MTTDLEDRAVAALATRAGTAEPRHDLAGVVRDATRLPSGDRPEAASGVRDQAPAAIDPGLVIAHGLGSARDDRPRVAPVRGGADAPVGLVEVVVRRRRRRWVPALAAAAAIAGIAGVAVATSRDGSSDTPGLGQPGPATAPPSTVPRFSWETRHASLAAESITIEYLGQTFSPDGADVQLESYLGSRTSETLKIVWPQHGIELGWELNFTLRDDEWWLDQMSVLDDRSRAEGNPQTSPAAGTDSDGVRMPLGEPVSGDLDLQLTDGQGTAHVVVTGMRLLGFRDRLDDPSAPTSTQAPPILVAAPPLPADVRPTGMYTSAEEWMAVLVAREELTRECMARAGIEYPAIPDDVLIQTQGQFGITAGLSVHGRAAAAATGYHTVDDGILNGGAHDILSEMSSDEQDAYRAALGGGTSTGCLAETSAAMGNLGDNGPMRAWGVVGDIRQQAFDDPNMIAALDSWGPCVIDAVGERAANPNELARMYAFENGHPSEGQATEHERAVAVADFDCQRQVDYERVWYTAVVERERVAMGDRVGEYDQWVREYQSIIAAAQQVLDERGIVLPALD